MNLRNQIISIAVLAGVAAALLSGGLTWWRASGALDRAQLAQALDRIQQGVEDYAAAHGSWAQAVRAEPFRTYLERTRHGGKPQDRRDEPFALLDLNGQVVLDAGPFILSQVVTPEQRQRAQPVRVGNEVVLQALPTGEVRPDERSRYTRAALSAAAATGIGVGLAVALLIAFALGRAPAAQVSALVKGLDGLRAEGERRRRLQVAGEGDLATLAHTLNDMADELGRAHARAREAETVAERQSAELAEMSVRDPLTGLFNRRHFDEQVHTLWHQALRHGRAMSIGLLDLDDFKQINDQYSHAMGDLVLKRVGQLLGDSVRKSDVIARYGSGEFIVVYPECNLAQATKRCEVLRKLIESYPWHEIDSRLKVTISAGVSDGVQLGDVEKMIGEADARLYGAKLGGQNRVEPAPGA